MEMREVDYRYRGADRLALDNASMTVDSSCHTALLGVNGAGKTTSFYIFDGVYRPEKGEVRYRGVPLVYDREHLTELRSEVGVVLQNPDDQMFASTVEEETAFGPLNCGMPRDEIEQRIVDSLNAVGMLEFRRRPLHQLSYGQRKRVAIAGALAMHPRMLIMDEPTAGLDPQMSLEVLEMAEELQASGTAVVISTHDADLAYRWADRIEVLQRGRSVYSGSPDGFYEDESAVRHAGLARPSVFEIDHEICRIRGDDPRPYPRSSAQLISRLGQTDVVPGRLLCLSAGVDGAPLSERVCQALRERPGTKVGVYGMGARELAASCGLAIDFYYDAVDACLIENVAGRDAVLICDREALPIVRREAAALAQFGTSVDLEVS
ncbi:MAG: ATP-binding cassette domain-containing protein [Methanomethylophilus sp.]